MFGSTHIIRHLAGLAAVAGAFAALVPIVQADSGFRGSPDAIDRAVAARQAELSSTFNGSPDAIDRAIGAQQARDATAFDAREHAQLALSSTSPDVVERAVRAQELNAMPDLSGMPDVLERTVAAGQLQYVSQPTTAGGIDWNDFGIGAGAGIGLMLAIIGIGALGLRRSHERVSTV